MALKSDIYGLNLNPTSGAITATSSATTLTVGTALNAIANGIFTALTTGAKALQLVNNNGILLNTFPFLTAPTLLAGSYTATNGATVTYGQEAIMVNCLAYVLSGAVVAPGTSGATVTLVSVVGSPVNIDANGSIIGTVTSTGGQASPGDLAFPDIPDWLVPVNFFTVKNPAGSSTATFTFGTTNWNATSIVTTSYDIATLPIKPRLSN